MFFSTIDEAMSRENRLKGYVHESMFFNPWHDRSTHTVQVGDKLLTQTDRGLTWLMVLEGDSVAGAKFKDVVSTRPDIKSIATPMKFEFDKTGIHNCNAYFDWGALGMGFGQMSFYQDQETGDIVFDTEMMGPETTRLMLHQFVDYIVDNGVSDDWKRKEDA